MKTREEMIAYIASFDLKAFGTDSTEKLNAMNYSELVAEYKATLQVDSLTSVWS